MFSQFVAGGSTWWQRCWGWRWRRSAGAGCWRGSWCPGWSGPAGEPGAGRTRCLRHRPPPLGPPPRQSLGCSWASLWTGRPVADPPLWPGCRAGSNTYKKPHTGACVRGAAHFFSFGGAVTAGRAFSAGQAIHRRVHFAINMTVKLFPRVSSFHIV